MTLLELLKAAKEQIDELQQTDGFGAYKEAGGKVTAATTSLFAAMDKCTEDVTAMAGDLAKTLAEDAVKEGYVTKEAHDKALADMKAESDKAVEVAQAKWADEQKVRDAQASVIAERMDKFREKKVETIPDALKEIVAKMSTDDVGNAEFTALLAQLDSRRKACEDAGVVLSERIDGQIVTTLAESEEGFTSTLELWKSLVQGKSNASRDKKKGPGFVPDQKSVDAGKKAAGIC